MKLITFLGDFSATWTGMADVESGHGMCWRTAGMSSGMELRVDMGATKKGWHVNCGLRQHPPLALIISGQWWKRPIPIRYLPHGGDHHPQVLGTSFDRLSTQHCVVHGWWQQCFDLGDRKPFNWLQLWSAAHFCLYSLFGCHRQNNSCLYSDNKMHRQSGVWESFRMMPMVLLPNCRSVRVAVWWSICNVWANCQKDWWVANQHLGHVVVSLAMFWGTTFVVVLWSAHASSQWLLQKDVLGNGMEEAPPASGFLGSVLNSTIDHFDALQLVWYTRVCVDSAQ